MPSFQVVFQGDVGVRYSAAQPMTGRKTEEFYIIRRHIVKRGLKNLCLKRRLKKQLCHFY